MLVCGHVCSAAAYDDANTAAADDGDDDADAAHRYMQRSLRDRH